MVAVTTGLFVLAVLLTQYPKGGGVEWGGRFFMLAVPGATALLLRPVADGLGRLSGRAAPAVAIAAALVIVSLLDVSAVRSLRRSRGYSRDLVEALVRAERVAAVPFADEREDPRPIAIATNDLLPQIAWNRYLHLQWLAPDPDRLADYGGRLAGAGARRIVLVSPDPKVEAEMLGGWYVEVDRAPAWGGPTPPVAVLVLERRGAPL